jgi:hypothetical protein
VRFSGFLGVMRCMMTMTTGSMRVPVRQTAMFITAF